MTRQSKKGWLLFLSFVFLLSGCSKDSTVLNDLFEFDSDRQKQISSLYNDFKNSVNDTDDKESKANDSRQDDENDLEIEEYSANSDQQSHVYNPVSVEQALGVPSYEEGESLPDFDLGAPEFSEEELSMPFGTEIYSKLDSLGRVGEAFAILGVETAPAKGEERGSISSIHPTGWVQNQYDFVDGKALYNRSHLIGWQLGAENANEKNLMTGTRYMNVEGMLPFEDLVDDYIERTGNHVAYKITPWFEGDNLVANGVQMQMQSIEDDEISYNVYCYNVQPGIVIDYKTGNNYEK